MNTTCRPWCLGSGLGIGQAAWETPLSLAALQNLISLKAILVFGSVFVFVLLGTGRAIYFINPARRLIFNIFTESNKVGRCRREGCVSGSVLNSWRRVSQKRGPWLRVIDQMVRWKREIMTSKAFQIMRLLEIQTRNINMC